MARLKVVRSRRGRPLKFGRPSRAVTLTLPEDIIAALHTVDDDVSRAVVRLSQRLVGKAMQGRSAELAKYGDSAVIVVQPTAALDGLEGVTLVPLPDGRALISLDHVITVAEFELRIRDLLDETERANPRERATLRSIVEILRTARHTRGIRIDRRSIIVLQSTRHRRIAGIASDE